MKSFDIPLEGQIIAVQWALDGAMHSFPGHTSLIEALSATLVTLRSIAGAGCDPRARQEAVEATAAYRSACAVLVDTAGLRCQCSACQPSTVTASERGLFW